MISLQVNLGVLPLDEAVIRRFVKIDLVVAQLAQKGQIAGPVLINGQSVLIRILISREPASLTFEMDEGLVEKPALRRVLLHRQGHDRLDVTVERVVRLHARDFHQARRDRAGRRSHGRQNRAPEPRVVVGSSGPDTGVRQRPRRLFREPSGARLGQMTADSAGLILSICAAVCVVSLSSDHLIVYRPARVSPIGPSTSPSNSP